MVLNLPVISRIKVAKLALVTFTLLFGSTAQPAWSSPRVRNVYLNSSSGGGRVDNVLLFYTRNVKGRCSNDSYNSRYCSYGPEIAAKVKGHSGSCPNQYHLVASIKFIVSGSGKNFEINVPFSDSSKDEDVDFDRSNSTYIPISDKNNVSGSTTPINLDTASIQYTTSSQCKYHGY